MFQVDVSHRKRYFEQAMNNTSHPVIRNRSATNQKTRENTTRRGPDILIKRVEVRRKSVDLTNSKLDLLSQVSSNDYYNNMKKVLQQSRERQEEIETEEYQENQDNEPTLADSQDSLAHSSPNVSEGIHENSVEENQQSKEENEQNNTKFYNYDDFSSGDEVQDEFQDYTEDPTANFGGDISVYNSMNMLADDLLLPPKPRFPHSISVDDFQLHSRNFVSLSDVPGKVRFSFEAPPIPARNVISPPILEKGSNS